MNFIKSEVAILTIGFSAQVLYSLRFIIQWLASEKNKQSLFTLSFWYLSLVGGVNLLIYSYLRDDPVYKIGVSVTLIVYIRNIILFQKKKKNQGDIKSVSVVYTIFFIIAVVLFFLGIWSILYKITHNQNIFKNGDSYTVLAIGIIGQMLFTGRFVVQWIFSEIKKDNTNPLSFWILSLIGGLALLFYAILLKDIVFIFSQLPGVVVYSRNIVLHRKQ